MSITIEGVSKRFGAFTAIDRLSLEIASGELVALLGPSGSGKTTLLRIIAGLEQPDEGRVLFTGRDQTGVSAKDRGVGFVFQHYALFRHMTVAENVAFGLRVRPRATRPPASEIRTRVEHLLKMVHLEWAGDRFPHQLSGGQRQRVALARALAVEPKVLLLDEPFGALDAKVRAELRRWLRDLHDATGVTTVFVTHDQEEALEVADRVVIINRGRIEQAGTPDEVYAHPANAFVHQFLGTVNVFRGRVQGGSLIVGEGDITVVRPHDIAIARARDERHPLAARVRQCGIAGALVRVDLALDDGRRAEALITHQRARELALQPGEAVWIGFDEFRTYAAPSPVAEPEYII
ncbi:MAG: sulfate ABC transporter ATP-binding protein [Planctomycetota bacterium]|nr:sulfate ABC transporter ATP-binding protein [Planctomycetota bacterium]MCX8039569.1 sulfate ABC transporter ATP-binding protein [Planctomycetota bacterium]MDW8373821.1 sulfate ABC transporter ATP-binding protein [Planctomycetota bacterium]